MGKGLVPKIAPSARVELKPAGRSLEAALRNTPIPVVLASPEMLAQFPEIAELTKSPDLYGIDPKRIEASMGKIVDEYVGLTHDTPPFRIDLQGGSIPYLWPAPSDNSDRIRKAGTPPNVPAPTQHDHLALLEHGLSILVVGAGTGTFFPQGVSRLIAIGLRSIKGANYLTMIYERATDEAPSVWEHRPPEIRKPVVKARETVVAKEATVAKEADVARPAEQHDGFVARLEALTQRAGQDQKTIGELSRKATGSDIAESNKAIRTLGLLASTAALKALSALERFGFSRAAKELAILAMDGNKVALEELIKLAREGSEVAKRELKRLAVEENMAAAYRATFDLRIDL